MFRSLIYFVPKNVISRTADYIKMRQLGLYSPESSTPSAGTMDDVRSKIIKSLRLEERYTPITKSREDLLKYHPKVEDLPPRSMSDSLTSAIIPLSTDNVLHNRYASSMGRVRMGRVIEEMDMFAVWVCHQHIYMPKLPQDVGLPYTFVTILVHRVDLSDYRPKASEDIRFTGHVMWVGNTSMEISVWMDQKHGDQYKKITRAKFLMAARNATNNGSAPINPLKPANEKEQQILAYSEGHKKIRQELQAKSVLKTEPSPFEQTLIYSIFKRTTFDDIMDLNVRFLPENCRWMSHTLVTNTIASFPEYRNAQNTVFGGFLMRNAQEISWISAFKYAKLRPSLKHISDISFHKPVPVAAFIRMNAYVVYTERNFVEVMVVSDVLDVVTGDQVTTNVFYFTYEMDEDVPEVLPRTYHEAVWYLQGRRKFQQSIGLE